MRIRKMNLLKNLGKRKTRKKNLSLSLYDDKLGEVELDEVEELNKDCELDLNVEERLEDEIDEVLDVLEENGEDKPTRK